MKHGKEEIVYFEDGTAVVPRGKLDELDSKRFNTRRIKAQIIFHPPKIRVAGNGALITQNCKAQDHGGGYEGA